MQKLELEEKREKRAKMRMVSSEELLKMNISANGLEKLAVKYEDLYFLVNEEGIKGIAIPTHRPHLIEAFKREKPIKKRDVRLIEIIENGRREQYILIML
jgi:hypothetical protein